MQMTQNLCIASIKSDADFIYGGEITDQDTFGPDDMR